MKVKISKTSALIGHFYLLFILFAYFYANNQKMKHKKAISILNTYNVWTHKKLWNLSTKY